jgi:hypothetical protein
VPPDGTPPIDEPRFLRPEEVRFLAAQEPVVAVEVNRVAKASHDRPPATANEVTLDACTYQAGDERLAEDEHLSAPVSGLRRRRGSLFTVLRLHVTV